MAGYNAPIIILFDDSEEEDVNMDGEEMRKVPLGPSGLPRLDAYVNYVS
jgi:hypothetical protein